MNIQSRCTTCLGKSISCDKRENRHRLCHPWNAKTRLFGRGQNCPLFAVAKCEPIVPAQCQFYICVNLTEFLTSIQRTLCDRLVSIVLTVKIPREVFFTVGKEQEVSNIQ